MSKTFLDKVYDVEGVDATRDLYDAWSQSYEDEVRDNGYALPGRAAEALAAALEDKTAPILDFGCGTGLSGLAFKLHGFTHIDGVDLSADMLAQAEGKNVYTTLTQISADGPKEMDLSPYAAVAAVGVIGAGAAPLDTLQGLFDAMPSGAALCFSFNDHTLEDPSFDGYVQQLFETNRARLLSREYGDHLPVLGINSVVYVIDKL